MILERNLFHVSSNILANAVVFDLETTGLSPSNDEIIQIAAVRIQAGKVNARDQFFSYVKPRRKIDPFITSLTGITNRHVKGAPRPLEILKRFSAFCGDSLLIAHNGHAFDVPFLRSACGGRKTSFREYRYIDSMHLSWLIWGRERGVSHSLDHVVARLRVDRHAARRHDARGDVALLADCVLRLIDRLDRVGWQREPKVYSCTLPSEVTKRAAAPYNTAGAGKPDAPPEVAAISLTNAKLR